MIRLSGRALDGLDEFMLRVGHLRVLAFVAERYGGSRHRVERATAQLLEQQVAFPFDNPSIAEYLKQKRLCPIVGRDDALDLDELRRKFRYPDIHLHDAGGTLTVEIRGTRDTAGKLSWQDLKLSAPSVPSKVGAVTTSAKSGSKTGLSHIFDWADSISLLSRTAQAGPIARLLNESFTSAEEQNPYIHGHERIYLAYLIFGADIDVLSRLLVNLSTTVTFPLKKRDAAKLYAETITQLDRESIEANYLTAGQRFGLSHLLRDLKKAARAKREELGDTSTAWHRTSSRLEVLVDLGILAKGLRSSEEKFEYVYYAAPSLEKFSRSFQESTSVDEWFRTNLSRVLSDSISDGTQLSRDDLRELLRNICKRINSPTGVLPLDAVALGVMKALAGRGIFPSYHTTRTEVEEFARKNEELARLARGSGGTGAEYITINQRVI